MDLESFGLLTLGFSPLNSSFVKPRNAIAKRGVFLYNENGIRRILPAIKVAGGRTQRLHVESVCGQGFKRRAIKTAVKLAKPNDVVIITGKGSEPWMCVANGKKIPWDDRKIAVEALAPKILTRRI